MTRYELGAAFKAKFQRSATEGKPILRLRQVVSGSANVRFPPKADMRSGVSSPQTIYVAARA